MKVLREHLFAWRVRLTCLLVYTLGLAAITGATALINNPLVSALAWHAIFPYAVFWIVFLALTPDP